MKHYMFLILFCSFYEKPRNKIKRMKKKPCKNERNGVVFRNFQFAYERIITKKVGCSGSYGLFPLGRCRL